MYLLHIEIPLTMRSQNKSSWNICPNHVKKIKESSLPVQKNSYEVSGTIVAAKLAKLLKMFKIRAKQGIKTTIFKNAIGESKSFSC